MFSNTPGTQGELIQKYNELADLLNIDKLDSDGVCYGLSIVYLDYAKRNELDEFFSIKRIISSLSKKDIEKLAQYYRIYYAGPSKINSEVSVTYNKDKFTYPQILDFIDRVNSAQKEQNRHSFLHTSLSWEETQLISTKDNPGDLTLSDALNATDSQFLQLNDHYHACSVFKTEEGLFFFDPDIGEQQLFKTANELQQEFYHGNEAELVFDSRLLTRASFNSFFVLHGLSIITIDPIVDDLIEKAKVRFKDDPDWIVDMENALANYKLGDISNKGLFGTFLDFLAKKSGMPIKTNKDALNRIEALLEYEFAETTSIERLQSYLNSYFQQQENLDKFFSTIDILYDTFYSKKENEKKIFKFAADLINVKDGILLKSFIEYIKNNNIEFDINRKFKTTVEKLGQKHSLLEIAVESGSVSCIHSLRKYGAEIEDLNRLLIAAAKQGQVQVLEYFAREFDEEEWPIDKMVGYAIKEGHIDVAKIFLPKHRALITGLINNYRGEDLGSTFAYQVLVHQQDAKILYDLQNLGCVIEDDFKVQLFKTSVLTEVQAAATMIEYDSQILQRTIETISPEKFIKSMITGGAWEVLRQMDLTQISKKEKLEDLMNAVWGEKWECAAILMTALDPKQVPKELSTDQKALIVDAYLKLLETQLNKQGLSDTINAEIISIRDGKNGLSSLFKQRESVLELFWSASNNSAGSQSGLTRRLVRLEELVAKYWEPSSEHQIYNNK